MREEFQQFARHKTGQITNQETLSVTLQKQKEVIMNLSNNLLQQ